MESSFKFRYPLTVYSWPMIFVIGMQAFMFLGFVTIPILLWSPSLEFALSLICLSMSLILFSLVLFWRYEILKFIEGLFEKRKDFLEITQSEFAIPEICFIKKSVSRRMVYIPLDHIECVTYRQDRLELSVSFKYGEELQKLCLKQVHFKDGEEDFLEVVNFFMYQSP